MMIRGLVLAVGMTAVAAAQEKDKLLTPKQEQQIAADEQSILEAVSKDTGYPIVHPVKLQFLSRDAVSKDLRQKFDEDKGNKRLERAELVMKKFGLLDRSFQTKTFLLSLLTEQIAGYYDNKTKQMTLLNWVPEDEQRAVLAHELTHALQDQTVDLKKWGDNEIEGTAKTVAEDNRHIAVDETDTAREAVTEGQAMISFADNLIAANGGAGHRISEFPDLVGKLLDGAGAGNDSPVLQRAPLVLQRSLLFPYTDGLKFEVAVLSAKGMPAAMAGMLKRPPNSSYEVMTPEVYLARQPVVPMAMPDLHPAMKKLGLEPYDVGVMGELDVQILAELFGGRPVAEAIAPKWKGGIYLAAQRSAATDKRSTESLVLVYASQWQTEDAARKFVELYDAEMPRLFAGAKRVKGSETDASEHVYATGEGDMLVSRTGTTVWVSESVPLEDARAMRDLVLGAQGAGPVLQAGEGSGPRVQGSGLVGGLGSWLGEFGVVKAVVERR